MTLLRVAAATIVAMLLASTPSMGTYIPTYIVGNRTLVAVEPLLRSLQIGYDIEGTSLKVDGRQYPKPLVERDGYELVDAAEIAQFLHVSLTKRNGQLVFATIQPPGVASPGPPAAADLFALRSQLLDTLNAHRRSIGIAALRVDAIAQAAAQAHAEDMARDGIVRHGDAKGYSPMTRYMVRGGHAMTYAENVAWYGLNTIDRASLSAELAKLDAQMMAETPPNDGHRRSILSPAYDGVGIGIAIAPSGLYLTEDFAGR